MVKIIANYVWNEFQDIRAQKVLIKKILLILFVPECPETRFRHNLQLFLLYKSIKTVKRGQFWHFLRFLAIFGDFHFWQNLGGIARPNRHFQP